MFIVNAAGNGHQATCTECGWQGRIYSVPDTAYSEAKKGHRHEQ